MATAFNADYLARRAQLIAQDRALRADHVIGKELSEEERKADEILRRIRTSEAQSVWNAENSAKHRHGSQQMFPGMEFLTARETILKTELFDILGKMPKGGLLHAHLGAMVRVDVLLRLALSQPAMHVRVPQIVSEANIKTVLPQFRGLPRSQWTTHKSITDDAYEPDSWVPMKNARDNFSVALGGPEGFDRWLTDAITINPAEAYGTHNSTIEIWKKFQSTFGVSEGLIFFEPVLREYIREYFLSSIEDGISYLETRMLFHEKTILDAEGEETMDHEAFLRLYDGVVEEVKAKMKQEGRADEFVGSKVIYTVLRILPPEGLDWYLKDCIAMKKKFPHLIAGFDFVGHEDTLRPLIDYAEPLLRFVALQKEEGVEIPFMFHAGETLGDGTMADMNLYDAILLKTKRIGHGFSLIKHPKLLEICRKEEICVEVCPISNEILRLAGSMPMHPLPALMNQGVRVALCSDDPAIFGNMGLSFDFYQVFVASEVNGIATLRALVWDSIKYSSLEGKQKEEAFAKLERRWPVFVRYILDTYGRV
ncbi:Metallo-dependent hydrolase [Cubamyces sp. BRFM 1775]|nr:Metallo-dependent hydrolase [Cubamyces sp. BRFM 1775]